MEISVISIFPGMFDAVAGSGVSRRAMEQGALNLHRWDPRDFTEDKHRGVDDRPYGGGPGMVMKPGPLCRCIDAATADHAGPVLYLSPQGELLTQGLVEELSSEPAITLVAGRYEGIDERVIQTRVDREISIGDYVLSGGELAAMVLIEAVTRLIPGVLGNDKSARQDSFSNGLLDCPHFTRPKQFEGHEVPAVLLTGDHEKIRQWRFQQSLKKTINSRPDLLRQADFGKTGLNKEQIKLLKEFKLEQEDV
ncbi:MAG: tRNA (guanosine(37)-N1)-methyltransferase TrmD [Gammaproteobacteria bacterium]|nr:tRNA (guanosine(37)-N1)-methyltransferase TrmD [Gammaproteobacteria bacterium]